MAVVDRQKQFNEEVLDLIGRIAVLLPNYNKAIVGCALMNLAAQCYVDISSTETEALAKAREDILMAFLPTISHLCQIRAQVDLLEDTPVGRA